MKKPPQPMKNFPARYNGLGEPTGEQWLAAAKRAYKMLAAGGIVLLFGDRGPGKTRMAFELAHEPGYPDPLKNPKDSHFREIRPAIYRTAMEVFLEIRDTYRRDCQVSELEVMANLSEAVLLVIDEIQERGESQFEDQKLNAIIDSRYRDKRPTLLIANYKSAAELTAGISPSVLSRIQEGGGAIHCNWPSFRANPVKP